MENITIGKRNVRYFTVEEVQEGIVRLVLDNMPRCDREEMTRRDVAENQSHAFGLPRLSVEFSRGNSALDARLSVSLRRISDFDGEPGGENFKAYQLQAEMGWSSTGRSIANATASIKLYQEVLELAALIESAYGDGRIIGVIKE